MKNKKLLLDIGVRVDTKAVMKILATSTTDPLQLKILDLKLSKMNLQRVMNSNQAVSVITKAR